MDEDADRNPKTEGEIGERRGFVRELDQDFRECREKLEQKAAADPWDYWPKNHDDLGKPGGLRDITAVGSPPKGGVKRAERRGEIDFEEGHPPVEPIAYVIGQTRLYPHYWSSGDNGDITRDLDGDDATRVYLYYDLSPLPEYKVAGRIRQESVRRVLGIDDGVSQSTLNRLPGQIDDDLRTFYASETETLVRQWEGTEFEEWVREPTPETVAPDGEGVPPVQTIVRDLRSKTFKYIRLKRDNSVEVSKDAAMRVLVAAANSNEFVNDAAKNLNLKPWYDGGEIPTGQTLNIHIRKSSREQFTRMFLEANEELFEIADENDYFPDKAEVAIDITDWPFYGDPDADEYVQGTKPGRNFSRAWKYITLSLVGTDTPVILFVLPVKDRSNAPKLVRRLLRVASQYVNLHRVYLDAGTEFYNDDTISTVNEFGLELVMQGRKSGKTIKHFLNGMGRIDLEFSHYSYGVGDLDEDDYYAVGMKSEKRSQRRKSDPDEPMDDYTYFYTNVEPTETPPEELGSDFRRRWGIETGFRKIKQDFLAKSGSPESEIRTFYFNLAAHLYNIWTVANIRRAEEVGADLSKGNSSPRGE